jgi:tyrosine-protein phosphatase SIW14
MNGIIPLSFTQLDKGLYRSSYPAKRSLAFITSLNLKTMICLNPIDLRDDLREFCLQNDITLIENCDVGFNQEPFVFMNSAAVSNVIKVASNPVHRPCLLFSNKDVRTNCVVGCYRKTVQQWSLVSIFQELEQFATWEGSVLDSVFIEKFILSQDNNY